MSLQNERRASLTGPGVSCWTQWPAPSTMTSPRWSVTQASSAVGWAHEQHGVVAAADEQRGHLDLGALELGGELPVAVEVAVPVDAAGEPGALELGDVVVELGLGEPVGQAVGLREAVDEAPPVGRRKVEASVRRRLARRDAGEHAPHGGGGSATQLGVGHAGLLEVHDVEEPVPGTRPA
jgi:hypothetical protein